MSVKAQIERHPLPIGIQTFSILREEGCYYVDKTPLIRELIRSGRHYFLSRPRRFGKSLLVDTLQELFQGNESLFRGLDIHPHWDWSVRHPVVHLSFGGGNYDNPGSLENNLLNQLNIIERRCGMSGAESLSGPEKLQDLLDRLHHETGKRVVVLVDEYDKPVLDVIDNSEMATVNRKYLRGLYGTIKDCANDVRFVFVTGVSMFTKTSLFSELNNLDNISLDPAFAAICGYTDSDLDTVFSPELPGLDRDEIRRWYNGYHWLGKDKLYNPYDLLLLFRKREFKAHWFETGSPEFLFRLLLEKQVSPMELEGRMAGQGDELARLLGENNFPGFAKKFRSFLTGVPYPWHGSGDFGRYEAWYASMLYMGFRATGVDLRVEDMSSQGRSDMVVFHDGQIFVFEFKMLRDGVKVDEALDRAIAQIRERGYAEKYWDRGEPIHLIGMVFDQKMRSLLEIRAESF